MAPKLRGPPAPRRCIKTTVILIVGVSCISVVPAGERLYVCVGEASGVVTYDLIMTECVLFQDLIRMLLSMRLHIYREQNMNSYRYDMMRNRMAHDV